MRKWSTSLSILKLWLKVVTFKGNPHPCTINLVCDNIFQIDCGYQNSKSHDQNDEIINPFNLLGSIFKSIFKACGSCYFSINTGLSKKEKAISNSLM